MRLTEVENARLLAQLRGLTDEQWTAATDCTGWTVRDVAVHLIASAQAQANPAEFARQVFTGRRLTAEIGGSHWVDGVNEAQLRSRTSWSTMMLPEAWQRHSAAALKARRRMPAPVRALPLLPIGTGLGVHIGWQPLGYLFDMGFTRDVWVHRIDIALAAGIPSELTPITTAGSSPTSSPSGLDAYSGSPWPPTSLKRSSSPSRSTRGGCATCCTGCGCPLSSAWLRR